MIRCDRRVRLTSKTPRTPTDATLAISDGHRLVEKQDLQVPISTIASFPSSLRKT